MKSSAGVGKRLKGFFLKATRLVAWICGILLVLLLAVIIAVRVPAVQNKLVQRAAAYLEDRIGTKVAIGRILIVFPKSLLIEDLYLEDQAGDTLIFAHEVEANARLLTIMKKKIALSNVRVNTGRVFIKRQYNDSAFNYSYIVDAFKSGEQDSIKIEEEDQQAWAISLDNVDVTGTRVSFDDRLTGTGLWAYVGDLKVSSKETDLTSGIYRLKKVTLENADISYVTVGEDSIDDTGQAETAQESQPFIVDVEEISLTRVDLRYESPTRRAIADIGTFEIVAKEIDLARQIVRLKSLELSRTKASYFFNAPTSPAAPAAVDEREGKFSGQLSPWTVSLNALKLDDNMIQYYDLGDSVRRDGLRLTRLWISNLGGEINNIAVDSSSASADIKSFGLNELRNGLNASLAGSIKVDNEEATLSDFRGVVNSTTVQTDARLRYRSLKELASNIQDASFELDMKPSTIYASDILTLAPGLLDSLQIRLSNKDRLSFSGKIDGKVGAMDIRNLKVNALDSTALSLSGQVRGLPDIENTHFKIALNELRTTRTDIKRVVADSLLPEGIAIPVWLKLEGTFIGTYKTPVMHAVLTSSDGTIRADGKVDLRGEGQYDLVVEAEKLQIGKIISNNDLGDVDLKAKAVGSGTKLGKLDARLNLLVSRLTYKGYNYQELRLNGTLKEYLFSGAVIMTDENLDFTLKADMNYTEDIPSYQLTLDMKNIDMKALHLTERPLRARAILDVDLATADFKVLNGRVDIRKVAVFNGAKLYAIDSLLVASIDQVGESSIEIRSDIMTGDFKGTINIFALPTALRQHFNQYFSLDSTITAPTSLQKFDFNLILKNTELLSEVLLPPLEPFTPGKISGSFNSEESKLDLEIKIADIRYGGFNVDSASLVVKSELDDLQYHFGLQQLTLDTLRISDFAFVGTVARDSIRTSVTVLDSLKEKMYHVGAVLTKNSDAYGLHLLEDEVILNFSQWQVPSGNMLEFSEKGLNAEQFSISKRNQKVALQTSSKDSLINIVFEELELGNITRIISGAVPASGELNGELKFSSSNSGEFSSQLQIAGLTILHKPWGDVNLTMQHANQRYDFGVNIRGNRTHVIAKGNYQTVGDSSVLSVTTEFSPLNVELLEPLTIGQGRNMQGSLQGKLDITGTLPAFDIRGDLAFVDVTFDAVYLNSQFSMKNETISFRDKGIIFREFKMLDSRQNVATMSGAIKTESYQEFELDLTIHMSEFQVLNTTQSRDQFFFGLLKLDLDANVKGSSTHPVVTLNAGMSDDSNFTYIIPPSEAGVLEQEGIVRFVDKDALNDPFLRSIEPTEAVSQGFKGLELTANIELQDKETLNVIIDPESGDKLTVRGNSSLTLDIDPSGNMNLSGRYEISEGSYNLSFYKLVKREFGINKGSNIIWAGDPLKGQLDITASHSVDAAPVELVAGPAASDEDLGPYRQRLPFIVYLDIDGQLMAPEIGFRLDMPPTSRGAHGGQVYSKILDINTKEAEVNKQVFGLLILRTFVGENPLEASSGGDLTNSARMSASKVLSQQLNKLSSKIKGVELSVNVNSFEDYSSGQAQGRTQAELGISKTLFGDRLIVKMSGNVDIEGESTQTNASDYIGDIALEYKMTADGRVRVTGFRNSNYDFIDGELIETGAGLIYIKDYNALRELFKSNNETDR